MGGMRVEGERGTGVPPIISYTPSFDFLEICLYGAYSHPVSINQSKFNSDTWSTIHKTT